MTTTIHHLFVRAVGCAARVWLNGFPVVSLEPVGPVRSTAPPINHLLVGRGNELRVTLAPLGGGERGSLAGVQLEGSVRAFGPAEKWADPNEGTEVVRFGIPEDLREAAPRQPIELPLSLLPVRFDTAGATFRDRLVEAPVVDRDTVRAYAMHLRALLAAQDRAGIARALAPKFADYARAYDAPVEQILRDLDDHLTNNLFRCGLLLDFGADDIEATPWCDGRLWHVARRPGRPFVQSLPGADGLESQMDVYVGLVDGELRIVR